MRRNANPRHANPRNALDIQTQLRLLSFAYILSALCIFCIVAYSFYIVNVTYSTHIEEKIGGLVTIHMKNTFCVGCLITSQWVLTAKTCTRFYGFENSMIVKGGHPEHPWEAYVIPLHPETREESGLVLLRLARPFSLENPAIETTRLPSTTDIFTGEFHGVQYRSKSTTHMPELRNNSLSCQTVEEKQNICAYSGPFVVQEPGNPLVVKSKTGYVIAGLYSHYKGGEVYANVPPYLHEIAEIVAV